MPKYLCKLIWRLSEWLGIGLGRFAPYVFGKMISAEEFKVKNCPHGHVDWDDCPDCC